jgi:hypothetical protein
VQFRQRQVVKGKDTAERGRWGERLKKGKEDKQEMRAKRAKARAERRLKENDGASDGDNDEGEEIINTFVTESGEKVEYKRVNEPEPEQIDTETQPQNEQPGEKATNWQTEVSKVHDEIEFDNEAFPVAPAVSGNILWPSQGH